tara:strand:+ start:23 stop:490 length:468 start_codon:yes stop_codon:yes gene_type:complete
VIDTLLIFLRTGELGGVCIGMTRKAIQSLFGDPDDVGASADIWLYGDQCNSNLQLTFANDRVCGIGVYFFGSTNPISLPDHLNAKLWAINRETSVDELTGKLTNASVQWQFYEPLTREDQTCVLVESKIYCMWSHDKECMLQKIMLADNFIGDRR